MNHPRGAVVPRCFICDKPVVWLVGESDCVAIYIPAPAGKMLAAWVHWRCLHDQASVLAVSLQAHQDRYLATVGAARIARGLPADAGMN